MGRRVFCFFLGCDFWITCTAHIHERERVLYGTRRIHVFPCVLPRVWVYIKILLSYTFPSLPFLPFLPSFLLLFAQFKLCNHTMQLTPSTTLDIEEALHCILLYSLYRQRESEKETVAVVVEIIKRILCLGKSKKHGLQMRKQRATGRLRCHGQPRRRMRQLGL